MSTTKAKKTTSKKAEEPSKLFRRLNTVLLISTAEFAKATPTAQTKLVNAADVPIEFVPDFSLLSNRRLIRDNLLAGKDVSRELEFNGLVLSEEELRVLDLLKPVLAKIEALGPTYDWLSPIAKSEFTCTPERVCRNNGHYISRATALAIWKRASLFWTTGVAPKTHQAKTNGSYYNNRNVSYGRESVTIGCQMISRGEVEHIARHYGWDPVVEPETKK